MLHTQDALADDIARDDKFYHISLFLYTCTGFKYINPRGAHDIHSCFSHSELWQHNLHMYNLISIEPPCNTLSYPVVTLSSSANFSTLRFTNGCLLLCMTLSLIKLPVDFVVQAMISLLLTHYCASSPYLNLTITCFSFHSTAEERVLKWCSVCINIK